MIVNSLPAELFACRLLVVSGKGGVGKSTLAGALALQAAAVRPVQLVEFNGDTLPRLLGLSPEPGLRLAEGVEWQGLSLERALETYGMLKLRLRLVYNAVFEHRLVRKFLEAMPVLADLMMLGHIAFLVENQPQGLVLVDAPSTGSLRQMLDAPRAVRETAPAGPLRQAAQWIEKVLFQPDRSKLVLVVTPEELPVNEAIEIGHILADRLEPALVLVNRFWGWPLQSQKAKSLRRRLREVGAEHLAESLSLLQARALGGQRNLERLQAGVPAPLMVLPEVVGASGRRLLEELAVAFCGQKVFPLLVAS